MDRKGEMEMREGIDGETGGKERKEGKEGGIMLHV